MRGKCTAITICLINIKKNIYGSANEKQKSYFDLLNQIKILKKIDTI